MPLSRLTKKGTKMKLKLNKKKIKNLSKDKHSLPANMTPQVAGGILWPTRALQCFDPR